MKALCGADCSKCGYGKENGCNGCLTTNGCPFGKKCFIYDYIKTGGINAYEQFKQTLIDEFDELSILGMPKITELYAMSGASVNLAYPMPNGEYIKLLDDKSMYLCNQVECEFNDGTSGRCFGLVAGMDFLLVAEYGENGSDAELVIYKRR